MVDKLTPLFEALNRLSERQATDHRERILLLEKKIDETERGVIERRLSRQPN